MHTQFISSLGMLELEDITRRSGCATRWSSNGERTHIIADFSQGGQLHGAAINHLHYLSACIRANGGQVVFVSNNGLVNIITGIIERLFPESAGSHHVVRSLKNAYELLAAENAARSTA
jgi:hypothetical protein